MLLYKTLYIAAYAGILLGVIVGVLPLVSLAALLTAPFVLQNVRAFTANPVKAQTFVLTIQNYILLLYGYLMTILAGFALRLLW